MGKKKRLNRFITKWIKSDLPEDRSTVLLLGVTRIPTTPTAARRPCSLPLGTTNPSHNPLPLQNNSAIIKRNSFSSRNKGGIVRRNSSNSRSNKERHNNQAGGSSYVQNNNSKFCNSNKKHITFNNSQNSSSDISCSTTVSPDFDARSNSTSVSDKRCSSSISGSDEITPSNVNTSDFTPGPMMDRSVDSIGACSLDADASVDLTDWSEEQSSVGTLRSVSLPTPEPQPHLPSYLSLACTVSGYSTTTNYDPDRLARSRDASPHRLYDELNTPQNRSTPLYSIRNNLLSPPNVVPLPNQRYSPSLTPDTPKAVSRENMEDHLVARREFYSTSTKSTTTFMSKESRNFVTSMFTGDDVDGCIENGFANGAQSRCISFESKSTSYMTNGSGKTVTGTSYKEYSNGIESKSFIQQRVERLYGPGALAQGFFISKRQKNRLSESECDKSNKKDNEKQSNTISDNNKTLNVSESETNLKQSTSSPALPVLRHLRPEFRAQLPIISPKKNVCDNTLPKSNTVPVLKEEPKTKLNGHSKKEAVMQLNGNQNVIAKDDTQDNNVSFQRDGHYFLEILEKETKRLLDLADAVEKELDANSNLSEEMKGKLRAASGKARLLASQKMQQFRGLCTNNINQCETEAFPTTNEDLQGFWDMVLLQVDQVDALFKEIDTLRKNNWIETKTEVVVPKTNTNGISATKTKKIVNRPKSTSAVNEEIRKQRENQRKQLIEARRKAMREQKQNENIEIYVPESS